jgi:hypothetical protein
MDIIGIGGGDMEWTDLAQDSDQWRALVNTVMSFRVLKEFWEIRYLTG